MAQIRPVGPGDEPLLRDLRLRALRADPQAFASTAAEEAELSDEEWASRAAAAEGVVLIALQDGATVGMAGVRWFDGERRIASLWGMWVDPSVRGSGTGRELLVAVREWAAGHGGRFLRLGVLEGEREATGFYERLGFVRTGEERPFRRDPSRRAFWMVRPI